MTTTPTDETEQRSATRPLSGPPPSALPMPGGPAVLGVSADFHDSAAALVVDGIPYAAAEEERFSRLKHDPSIPALAIEWITAATDLHPDRLDAVVFAGKPLRALDRVISSHASAGVRSLPSLTSAVGVWSRRKIWIRYRLEETLRAAGLVDVPLRFCDHHLSHAAAAFYPSPFEHAAVLTLDGVGDWETGSISKGTGSDLHVLKESRFPDSLGLWYSAMTAFCGFPANEGEYRLMGLAPYGTPRYRDVMMERMIQIRDDGSVRLDPRTLHLLSHREPTRRAARRLLDGPPRRPDQPVDQREADIAASTQVILEEAILRTARYAHALTSERAVCLAGGVALNCVANRRLREVGPFDDVWIQPAAGDAGGALGAALWLSHAVMRTPRRTRMPDAMSGSLLGPAYDSVAIGAWLGEIGTPFRRLPREQLADEIAACIAAGEIVGWFQGRMEFGPRALGGRSILADPRRVELVQQINVRLKGRETFRPFAPAVLAEYAKDWFDLDRASPYMVETVGVSGARAMTEADGSFAERLARTRSAIPACTHVDGSARVQTVDRAQSPELHRLIEAFHRSTGVPVLLNTSFNRGNEPIVATPQQALETARRAGIRVLVLEDCIVHPMSGVDR